jgi:hypothetical protein
MIIYPQAPVAVLLYGDQSDISNIVGVNERLFDVPYRQSNLAGYYHVTKEAFAEILEEPAAAKNSSISSGILKCMLTQLSLRPPCPIAI